MATIASPSPIRAVIIDGPETGQIITLNEQSQAADAPRSAADIATSIENRVARLNLKAQEMVVELRRVNASFKAGS